MKVPFRILVFSLLLAVQSAAHLSAQDASPPMPQVLYSSNPHTEYPEWVAVESMLGPDGKLNSDYLDEAMIWTIETNMASPQENGCLQVSEAYRSFVNAPDMSSMRDVIRVSVLALEGKVTGKAFGFRDGEPGQLIRFEPVEVFYSQGKTLPEYFVFFPVGEFTFLDVRICKTDSRFPAVPDLGDEIFLAANPYFYKYSADSFVRVGSGNELFTVTKDGQVSLPFAFREGISSGSRKGEVPQSREALKLFFQSNARRSQ